jgi:hypothetical protein
MTSLITNFFIALMCLLHTPLDFDVSKLVQKRMQKEITKVFLCKDFDLEEVTGTPGFQFQNSTYLTDHQIYKINRSGELLGYAFLGSAPSKTDTFEYLILFDQNFIQKKAKLWFTEKTMGGKSPAIDGCHSLKTPPWEKNLCMEITSVPFQGRPFLLNP